jgi:hypothetical protein
VEGSRGHVNEPLSSIKCWEILEWLSDWWLLKTGSAPLHIYHHADLLLSHAMKSAGLIHTITFSFSTMLNLLTPNFALVYLKFCMFQLHGSVLRLLPINLRVYKGNLQPFAMIIFFLNLQYHRNNLLEKLNLILGRLHGSGIKFRMTRKWLFNYATI